MLENFSGVVIPCTVEEAIGIAPIVGVDIPTVGA